MDTFVYLINRRPSSSLDGSILEDASTSKKVNYSFLRTFACESFFHIVKQNRTKIEEKSMKCTFIGYIVNDFDYQLYDYENHKIIRSGDVVFIDNIMYKDRLQRQKKDKGNTKYIVLYEIIENEIPKVPKD